MTPAVAMRALLAGAAVLLTAGVAVSQEPGSNGASAASPAPAAAVATPAGSNISPPSPAGPAGKKAADLDNPLNPFAGRGGALPSALRQLMTDGVKLTALGQAGGLNGYLAEAANGRMQAVYPTPDGEHLVAGILFEAGGRHVTASQVADMMRRFTAAAKSAPDLDASSLPEIPAAEPHQAVDQPILDWFVAKGLKVTDMEAEDGGLSAFLVQSVDKDGGQGRMQVFYRAPDPRFAVAGLLLKRGGGNVTGVQIGRMQERALAEAQIKDKKGSDVRPGANSPAAPKAVPEAIAREAVADPQAPSATTSDAASAPDTAAAAGDAQSLLLPAQPEDAPKTVAVPAPVVPEMAISSKAPADADRFKSRAISSQDFAGAVRNTAFFTVGVPDKPAVYMVADPQCPYCHEAWRRLKPLVFNRQIQVRVIMIAGLRGSDPLARSILTRDNPSTAWLSGEGSIDGVKIKDGPAAGTKPWETAGSYLEMNANFLRRFDIKQTPFLAYTAADGALVASKGIPDDFEAFMAALR